MGPMKSTTFRTYSLFYTIILFSTIQTALAQDVLRIQTGAVLSCTDGAIITLHNMDLVNDGTFNQGIGQGTVIFSGTDNNVIAGNSITSFDMLQLSKSGSNKLSLQQGILIKS